MYFCGHPGSNTGFITNHPPITIDYAPPYLFIHHCLIGFFCFTCTANPGYGRYVVLVCPQRLDDLAQAGGDLNKDSIADVVMIIQGTDKKKFMRNEELGADTLDLNPRMLLVLFKQADSSYRVAAKNTGFIPSPGNAENPCESDPLFDTDALTVKKGVFTLRRHYWSSCGSYGTSLEDYVFRYQNGKFEMIGYASESTDRSSGEMNRCSVNFSTRKTIRTSGENMFYDTKEKPQTVQTSFKISELMNLETLTPESFDDGLQKALPAR